MADVGLRNGEREWAASGGLEAGVSSARQKYRVGDYAGAHSILAHFLSCDTPDPTVVELYGQYFPLHIDNSRNDRWRVQFYAPSVNCFVEGDLAKETLNNRERYVQQEGVRLLKNEGWNMQGLHDYNALKCALYLSRLHSDYSQRELISHMKEELKKDWKRWFMVESRVRWRPEGQQDLFIPHYDFEKGYDQQQGKEADLVGPDSVIKPGESLEDTVEVTHGIRDCQLVQKTGLWVCGKDPRYWRFNKKPKEETERVVLLFVVNDYFVIGLNDGIGSSGCVRGWSRRTERKLLE